ncbi:PH domain-containing protein DDB_G0275795-like [Lytechinus pictus]|uniref:PH domain-containing protein DDB_G0275795-like n=1 Tax=Lytechinus pictus TaxID=7653 RepID=UPI00240D3EE3|nr:PH domain-containing protein DDB_G0275795-like [Lytechinus pictus]
MKFNEKNVSYFASCNSPVDKTGSLLKKADNHRNFQKRWFVLKGNLLFYYDKEGDKEPQGVIILEGCRVELADLEDCLYCFQISFSLKDSRTYVMAATSQEEMESWMKALSCSSYDYMKAMVDELQKQLDDLSHGNSENSPAMVIRTSVIQSSEVPEADGATGRSAPSSIPAIPEHVLELPPKQNMSTYERGKTESLAHRGAPRQSAYQRNSLPFNNYSNPSYDIWDPLVSSSKNPPEQSNGAAKPIPQFVVEQDSSDSEDDEVKPSDSANNSNKNAQTDYKADQTDGQHVSRLASKGRKVMSVFYENLNMPLMSGSSDTSPRLSRKSVFGRGGNAAAQGPKSAQAGQSVFHVHNQNVRTFSDMHEEFGMLIVRKMNLFRQRKTSGSS